METKLHTVTEEWSKVIDSDTAPVTITNNSGSNVYISLTAADSAPSIDSGHTLRPGAALYKYADPGFVWARSGPKRTLQVVVTV